MDSWKPEDSGKERIKSKLLNMSRQQWVVLLLLGLLLVVASLPVSRNEKTSSGGMGDTGREKNAAEKTEMEEKLERLLSHVEGVGETEVILMTGEEKDREGFYVSGEPEVTGVLISAKGGGDLVVVRKIQEAVMALFQIEAHKIKVMKMK